MLSAEMSTMAVQRKHAHERVSFGVRSGTTLVPVELAVDYNRDGNIDLTGGSDQTSEATPYRFWINNDQDSTMSGGTAIEGEVVPVVTPDYTDPNIQCERDLEDWTRLWISLKGDATLIKGMVQNGYSVGLQFEAVSSTEATPSIKICEAVETTGSTGYITNDGIASQQITGSYDVPIEDPNGNAIIGSQPFMLPNDFWDDVDDNTPKHLIFEGVSEGIGKLKLVFYDSNNNKVGEGGAVYLDIENIKKMYERAAATPSSIPSPYTNRPFRGSTGFQRTPNGNNFEKPPDETSQCIVFVHGWNMTQDDYINFSETMFKRLWWQGYKGRFDAFYWATLTGDFTYNESEYRAWKYGQGLSAYVQSQKSLLPGYSMNIAAHSMGNIVAGSALVQGMRVNNYVLMEAAVPAGCYDPRTALNDPDLVAADNNNPTPDLSVNLGYRPYLFGIQYYVSGNIDNFYNSTDFALATGATTFLAWTFPTNWKANQEDYKPDQLPFVGWYQYLPNNPANQQCRMNSVNGTSYYVTDPHEAMAFIARSRTMAVGAQGATQQAINQSFNLNTQLGSYDFGPDAEYHSGQFNLRIQDLQTFYSQLMDGLGVSQPQ